MNQNEHKKQQWEEKPYNEGGQAALYKVFRFPDFKQALAFVNKIGALAEEANHHPDINLGWGWVAVWLTSHDEHKITEKDRSLAQKIDQIS